MSVKYERLPVVFDATGIVFEPIQTESLRGHRNVHVVMSEPGVVRGNHYHIRGEETLVVKGPVLVRYRDHGDLKEIRIEAGDVYRFVFPPGVSHAIKNLSEVPNILIAFNTIEHDPQNPDTMREILIESL